MEIIVDKEESYIGNKNLHVDNKDAVLAVFLEVKSHGFYLHIAPLKNLDYLDVLTDTQHE